MTEPHPRRAPEPRAIRVARTSGVLALALGLGHAAMSSYWLAGGTALLDTVGEALESWGRDRTVGGLLLLTGVTIVKVCVALLAAVIAGLGPFGRAAHIRQWARSRLLRSTGWVSAAVLVAYGGVLTVAGVLVDLGVVDVDVDEPRALRWHAYFWDPWFLLWGSALAVLMVITGRCVAPDRRPRSVR